MFRSQPAFCRYCSSTMSHTHSGFQKVKLLGQTGYDRLYRLVHTASLCLMLPSKMHFMEPCVPTGSCRHDGAMLAATGKLARQFGMSRSSQTSCQLTPSQASGQLQQVQVSLGTMQLHEARSWHPWISPELPPAAGQLMSSQASPTPTQAIL